MFEPVTKRVISVSVLSMFFLMGTRQSRCPNFSLTSVLIINELPTEHVYVVYPLPLTVLARSPLSNKNAMKEALGTLKY